jgi:hypothetical protein
MQLIDRSSLACGCLIVLASMSASCSRSGGPESAGAKGPAASQSSATPTAGTPAAAPAAPASSLPTTLTDVNLAAWDNGGAVEDISGNYGPGYTGRLLIDGQVDPTWKKPIEWSWNPEQQVKYPWEAVFSFYERNSALVGAVTIVPAKEVLSAPRDVEIWVSMDPDPKRYSKVASKTLPAEPGEQTISFTPTEARFVKLRVVSGGHLELASDDLGRQARAKGELEIAEVRILEAARADYVPLLTRAPEAVHWKGSPRDAAQYGLDWVQQAAVDWQVEHQCFGCHVQAQALMAQAVAVKQGYHVSMAGARLLAGQVRSLEQPNGVWRYQGDQTFPDAFGTMALARANELTGETKDPQLFKAVDYLMSQQVADGGINPEGSDEQPPIVQGPFMLNGNGLVGMSWAAAHSPEPKYRQAADRVLAWVATHEPQVTQDKIAKVVALMDSGNAEQKRSAWSVVERLVGEQQADGGWKETPQMDGSNAFATGQVLYAFKRAGVSVRSPSFQRGVDFLLKSQQRDSGTTAGSWRSAHSQSQRKTDFAPTMWAVIGLAGSYGREPVGALQVTKQRGGDPSAHNLEIVLDVSGSMNEKLGDGTRWTTALKSLKQVLDNLPDDLSVGLRVYGHRYSSHSAQTCTDTELIAPIARLDRARLMDAAEKQHPRGETPLIYSILQTLKDLKAAGGGTVVLITDGEESCHGDVRSAAAKIKASGLDVRLNIVGFTLTGQSVAAQLDNLAGSTGGHYYGAQDGAQLVRVVQFSALQRVPYDVLDAKGSVVAAGETSELGRELPVGSYRVRMTVLGQKLEEPVTVAADQTTSLAVAFDDTRLVLRQAR